MTIVIMRNLYFIYIVTSLIHFQVNTIGEGFSIPFSFNLESTLGISREGHLRIGTANVSTPHWVMLNTERQSLARGINLLNNTQPNIEFNEIVIDYQNQADINAVLNNPHLTQNLESKIRNKSRNNTENIFQLRVPSDVQFSRDQLTNLIQLQVQVGRLSVITIPDPAIGHAGLFWENQIMPRALELAQEFVNTGRVNTYIPSVSLNQRQEVVERKITWLLNHHVPSIGLKAEGARAHNRLNVATEIINKSRYPVWVHLFDVPKKLLRQVSQIHLAPLAGVDTISIRKGKSRGRPPQAPLTTPDFPTPEGIPLDAGVGGPTPPAPSPIRRDLFEGRALGFLSGNEQIHNFGNELMCRCPVCREAHFSVEELLELLSQPDRANLLKVHEYNAFPRELNDIQVAIHNNNLENYYNSKSLINLHRTRIREKYPQLGGI